MLFFLILRNTEKDSPVLTQNSQLLFYSCIPLQMKKLNSKMNCPVECSRT